MSAEPAVENPEVRDMPRIVGSVEGFRGLMLVGWASDGTPEPLRLDIFVDEDFFRTVRADRPRPDVIDAGHAVTDSGFTVIFPRAILEGHGVVKVCDHRFGHEIPGSPHPVAFLPDPEPARITRPLYGNVERFDGRALSGWVADGSARHAAVRVYLNGEFYAEIECNLPRQDVVDAGFTAVDCGFDIPIPAIYLGEPCLVRVLDSISGKDIPGSPLTIDPPALDIPDDTVEIGDLADLVTNLTERTTSVATLQTNAALIMNWLQRTVDRAHALADLQAMKFDNLNRAVSENGGLAGTLGHFYGLLQTQYRQIVLARHRKPAVSIVIPVHDKFDMTYNCIRSISEALTRVSFEVILVDDASSDETLLSPVMFQGGCHTVRTQKNEGFIGACNLGASRATGQYLLFLNNDTLVDDGWLDALSETLDDDAGIGIVGSRLVFADGTLQEAGGIVWRDASGWNWGRGQDRAHPTYSFMRDADYVSGAALMIRRRLFEQLGGFDDFYAPAYYEDTDLCFRVREAGFRVVVQPNSTIVHLEGQSNGTSTTTGPKRYQVVNARKFRSRWATTLSRHRLNGQEPLREAERGVLRRALFIDDSTPTPDRDAGSNAAFEHMRSLQRLGYKVVFLPADNMADIPVYTAALQGIGIECWYAPYAWSVEEYFRRSERDFDVVYIHRRANAQRYLGLVRKYVPGAKVIFNYADIHALRDIREAELEGAPPLRMAQLRRELESELDIANDVYSAIVHSTFEAEFIRSRRPDADVHYVPWAVEVSEHAAQFADRAGIAFVGGYGHAPNVDAVQWMVEDIWPRIARRKLGHAFRIIGSNMPERFRDYRAPDVEPVGFVANLDQALDGIALTVAPLRFGAGLKGKVLTSMARGVPCVMTSVAAEGLALPPEIRHLVRDDPEEFACEVASLLADEERWARTSRACLSFVRARFSPDVVDGLIKDAIMGRTARGHP